MTLHIEDVAVAAVAEAVLVEAAALTKDRPYRVQLSGDRPIIRSDRGKLQQILSNLVSNAIKFTPSGSVEVQIRAAPASGCTIAVVDTGIGIRQDDMKIIFEEFRQVDGSPTREFGGTGLGLAISRRFAELLGGTIAVTSELGRGSTFSLSLPKEPPLPRRSTMPPPPPPAAIRAGGAQPGPGGNSGTE